VRKPRRVRLGTCGDTQADSRDATRWFAMARPPRWSLGGEIWPRSPRILISEKLKSFRPIYHDAHFGLGPGTRTLPCELFSPMSNREISMPQVSQTADVVFLLQILGGLLVLTFSSCGVLFALL